MMQPLPPPPSTGPNMSGNGAGAGTDFGSAVSEPQNRARDHNQSSTAVPTDSTGPAARQETVPINPLNTSDAVQAPKKRRHRGGKKRRNKKQSLNGPPSDLSTTAGGMASRHDDHDTDEARNTNRSPVRTGESFYKMKSNRSDDSLDSDALLDHRNHQPMRPRRESRLNVLAAQRAAMSVGNMRQQSGFEGNRHHARRRTGDRHKHSDVESGGEDATDRTPLMAAIPAGHRSPAPDAGYGLFRPNTRASSKSSGRRRKRSTQNMLGQSAPKSSGSPTYDINNPPSVPSSPHMHASIEDPMMPDHESFFPRSPSSTRNTRGRQTGDVLIDIDRDEVLENDPNSAPPSPRHNPEGRIHHQRTMTFGDDVCMPEDAMSEMAEDEYTHLGPRDVASTTRRRHHRKEWPKLWVFDEWSREEKELRAADSRRAERIQEPMLVDGRLRAPRRSAWHREEAPNRFTYFNIEFESTIHAPTISELVPPDGDFRDLFIPEPPLLEDSSSSSESEAEEASEKPDPRNGTRSTSVLSPIVPPAQPDDASNVNNLSRLSSLLASPPPQRSQSTGPDRLDSIVSGTRSRSRAQSQGRSNLPSGEKTPQPNIRTKEEKARKYGKRPQFWLDVLCPTQQEMQVMKVAFGIHPLTAEDIMQQEAREKVELFRNYYFINYRTFEQDQGSEDFLEPVNMYILVFQHGIITFHFSQIPHPANVRRRIRQLQDYLDLSADWISYAIIDDITDVFFPMISNIEAEVDEIDEAVLESTPGAFAVKEEATGEKDVKKQEKSDDKSDKSSLFSLPTFLKGGEKKKDTSGYDMLRRLGESRKKVMSLYRLLSTKADVIKGFAKRCNDQLDLKNEIGLYLGDIQDHILTMTSSLSHYEALLGRAHSNYLAQVSIRMNERSEQTGDILNKLTVFGTIVLPMNIICGMWGMNVKVPGQEVDNLWWFWGITAGLMAFAVGCYLLCRKMYGIV